MALPIILADQRLAERRGIKAAIFGKSGIGKTSLLWTLDPQTTLFIDLEAGDLAIEGWTGDTIRPRTWEECRDFAVFIGGSNPAIRDGQPYSPCALRGGDAALRRSGLAREIPHGLRRLDHRCRAPVLPVVEGAAGGLLGKDRQARCARRLRPAWPRDDRMDHASPAHPGQERLLRWDPRREAR